MLFKFPNFSLGFKLVVPSHIFVYSSSVVSCKKQMNKNFTNFNKLVADPFKIKREVVNSAHLQPTKYGTSAPCTSRPLVVKDNCIADVRDVAGTGRRSVRIQHSDLSQKIDKILRVIYDLPFYKHSKPSLIRRNL